MPNSPFDVDDLRVRVHKVLEDFLARQLAVLESVSPDCTSMVEFVSDLMRGGKRLRPAFCYWGWRGAGGTGDGPDGEAIVLAASALEFFQAAALIHDDVMDDSDTRRGIPAVHRRFATLHRGAGWTGDGERFGLAGAVLAGDLCLAWSDELFTASGLTTPTGSADAGPRGRAVFDRMRTELMGGQYLDMFEQAIGAQRPHGATQRARQVIRYKSAKYTIEQPLLIGGSLAGADPDLLAGYSAFGLPLGEAFQLRDDVLGVFGDPARTGKPAGDDLREGKRTVLIAQAFETSTPAQAQQLRRLLGDAHLDLTGVHIAREILVETGALDAVEALVEELVDTARSALAGLPDRGLSEQAHQVLDGLVEAATTRVS